MVPTGDTVHNGTKEMMQKLKLKLKQEQEAEARS